MSGWVHDREYRTADQVLRCHVIDITNRACGCTNPTPDPASPCGYEGCLTEPGYGPGVRLTPHFVHDLCSGDGGDHGPSCHPHQPTLCTCGHPIKKKEEKP